jgi:cytochrome P450
MNQIGQIPWLDNLFMKNPVRKWMSARGLIQGSPVVHFALKRIAEAKDRNKSKGSVQNIKTPPRDFVSRFQEAHDKDPKFMTQGRVVALTTANMIAGSDTTAISLRSIFYNLIRNPDKLAKLHGELEEVVKRRDLKRSDTLFTWDEVRELPYLSAVINESLRAHPAVGLALERIVPTGGLQHDDMVIPARTNIGCNAWALHLDEHIWGPKPEDWIPERWIDAISAQKSAMKNSLFSFGAGARTCAGKNISYLEMYKLVPALLRAFDVSEVDVDCVDTADMAFRSSWHIRKKSGSYTMRGL